MPNEMSLPLIKGSSVVPVFLSCLVHDELVSSDLSVSLSSFDVFDRGSAFPSVNFEFESGFKYL